MIVALATCILSVWPDRKTYGPPLSCCVLYQIGMSRILNIILGGSADQGVVWSSYPRTIGTISTSKHHLAVTALSPAFSNEEIIVLPSLDDV